MSEENVETVKRNVEAYRRGDIAGFLIDFDDDVELDFSTDTLRDGKIVRYQQLQSKRGSPESRRALGVGASGRRDGLKLSVARSPRQPWS